MKILVTGSSGLIGNAICEKLSERRITPITMDINSSPNPKFHPKFSDVRDIVEVSRALKNVEGVIHLAAVSRVIDGEKNPTLCTSTNIQGTNNILDVLTKTDPYPWVIFGSSREVYGEPIAFPVSEDHPLNPMNVYGETKKESETRIQEKVFSHNIDSVIFRYSNVYGSIYDHPTRVIPAFMWAALKDQPLRIDCPDHIFDFTFIDDTVEATMCGVEALAHGSSRGVRKYNVSPGIGTSLMELVDIISGVTGKELITVPGRRREYDVGKYYGDVKALETDLGYKCSTSIKTGLTKYFRACMEAMEL